MAVILKFGFLSVLVSVVMADFEYSAQIVATLPDYQGLLKNEKGSFEYDLINPEGEIRLSRRSTKNGLHFDVEPDFTSKTPGVRSRENGKSETQLIYSFSKINFDVFLNEYDRPYMRLTLKYENPTSKETVGVVMYPLKPPNNEVDKEHAKDFQVPQVNSPISLPEFPMSTLTIHNTKDTQGQEFIGNILSMKDILQRAKRMGRTRKSLAPRYTEWYLAGPIIMEEEEYDKILDLFYALDKYAPQEKIA